MGSVTRFATRDAGPAARIVGFMDHLRENGLNVGIGETKAVLRSLVHLDAHDPMQAQSAMRAVCTGCSQDAERFGELFESYWLNNGRVRARAVPAANINKSDNVHSSLDAKGETQEEGSGPVEAERGGDDDVTMGGVGRLVASRATNMFRRDLRELVRPSDIDEAEAVARRLGKAMRDRRSRRRRNHHKGAGLNFRRIIRRSLATGGEPLELLRMRPVQRPVRVVALCDVSGSMSVYARVFLSFIAGLMRSDPASDAYLFHTRLVRITEALRDRDAMRAVGRLSLLGQGFGGGSMIGNSLETFSRTYARKFVNGRSVVMIMSDGYDTGAPELVGSALENIRRRGCKIIWLNPLKGWRDYAPVAQGMTAALPFIDLFRPARCLADLAELETEFAKL